MFRKRPCGLVVAGVVSGTLLAGLLVVVPGAEGQPAAPAEARAQSSDQTTATGPTSDAPRRHAATGRAARTVRQPKVRSRQWTSTSATTFAGDGTAVTKFYGSPRFHRTEDGWEPLSGQLRRSSGRYPVRADDTLLPLRFGAEASSLLRLDLPLGPVRFELDGAQLGTPRVTQEGGNHFVSYSSVFPGVDLRYTVHGAQVKEEFVLRHAHTRRAFSFQINDPEHRLGSARADADGAVTFGAEVADQTRLGLAAPAAWEQQAQGVPGAKSHRDEPRMQTLQSMREDDGAGTNGPTAHQRVRTTAGGYRVDLSLDDDWARTATFPVVLDPTIYYAASDQTMAASFAPVGATACNGSPCPLSTRPGNQVVVAHHYLDDEAVDFGESHAYFHVDLSNIPEASVDSLTASFGFGYNYQVYPDVDLHSVSEVMDEGSTGADLAAAEEPELIGHLDSRWVGGSSLPSIDLTDAVRTWILDGRGAEAAWAMAPTPGLLDPDHYPGTAHYCYYYGLGCYAEPVLTLTTEDAQPLPPPIPVEQTWGCDCRWAHGADNTGTAADPVKTVDGSAFETVTDLSVPAPGVPVRFRRSYNGADTSDGPLGVGWTFEYNASLSENPTTGEVTFRDPTGGRSKFTLLPSGEYLPDPGVTGDLIKLGGAGWSLTSLRGETLTFDGQGRELADVNSSGDGVTLTYETVAGASRLTRLTDEAGATTLLTYGTTGAATGKIATLTAPGGRVVSYAYLTVNGQSRLQKVTGVDGKVTTLSYDKITGRLNLVASPRGSQNARNLYDAQGRVIQQTDAAGQISTFQWETDPDTGIVTQTTTDPLGHDTVDRYYGNVRIEHVDADGYPTRWFYDADLNLIATMDPNGNISTMSYNEAGDMVGRDLPDGTSEQWTYDAHHRPLTHTDGLGNTTSTAYDAAGRPVAVTDPLGRVTSFTYDQQGLLLTQTSPAGRVTTMTYDAAGRLTSSTSPGGRKTTNVYDSAGNLASSNGPYGPGTVPTKYLLYDKVGRVLLQLNPDGTNVSNVYDADGNLTSSATKYDSTTLDQNNYTYDALNRMLTSRHFSRQTSYTYDAVGNLLSVTDPTGAVTRYTYSPAGRRLTMTTAKGNLSGANPVAYTWTYAYDGNGNRIETTDPTGATTSTAYDALNRPFAVTDPNGDQTTTVYDPAGRVSAVTDPIGRVTTTGYDEVGNLVSQTLPDQSPRTWTYDADGNPTAQTSPSGSSTTTWTYTPDGQVATQVDPTGNTSGTDPALYTTTYSYDLNGNLTEVTNPLGETTAYEYDPLNQRIRTTDAAGHITRNGYDRAGNLTRVTAGTAVTAYAYNQYGDLTSRVDAEQRTTRYTVDAAGRPTTRTDPLGRVTTTTYDTEGHTTRITRPSGATTKMTYDAVGRLTTTTGAATSTGPVTLTTSLTYEPDGHVATMTDPTGTTAYDYDPAGQLSSLDQPGVDDYSYTYNAAGQLDARMQPVGGTVAYTYDTDGLLATQASDGGVTSYTYTPEQRLATTTLPASVGRIQTRSYDRAGRISKMAVTTAGAPDPLAATTYARNEIGAPIRVTHTHGTTATTESFDYDSRGFLAFWCPTSSSCNSTFSNKVAYAYDLVGNRTTRVATGTVPEPGTTTTSYDAADEAITEVRTGGSNPGTTTNTYNLDGQLTTGGRTYNSFGQLAGQTTANGFTTYTYNGLGLRRATTDNTGTTSWSWDPNNSIPLLAATTSATGVRTAHRYDPSGTPLATINPTATDQNTWYATDALGTVTDTLTNAGALARTYAYDPWGATLTNTALVTGAPQASFGYTGATPDPGTASYYLRARVYDPAGARFTTLDPHPQNPTAPWLSDYAYVGNQPTLYTDPTGLCWGCDVVKEAIRTSVEITTTVINLPASTAVHTMQEVTDHASGCADRDLSDCGVFFTDLISAGAIEATWNDISGCADHQAASCGRLWVTIFLLGIGGGGCAVSIRATEAAAASAAEGAAARGTTYATRPGASGVDGALNGARPLGRLPGEEISAGHAFDKHVIERGEFPGITTRGQFAAHIDDVVANGVMRTLNNGRTAYWQDGTVVIRNPRDPDGGTAFRPTSGYEYFLDLD